MVGMIDDVYVWNRALSADEIGQVMTSRTLAGAPELQQSLLVWFPMRDGTGSDSLPLPDYSGNPTATFTLASTGDAPPAVVDAATPAVVPCVRGLEMPVGPTDGTCVQGVYGWNFARSAFNSVMFGDVKVPATFVDGTEMKAETPGYQSPRFVSVTASNNGETFTAVSSVGKDTTFLYLDAGLYMDGRGRRRLGRPGLRGPQGPPGDVWRLGVRRLRAAGGALLGARPRPAQPDAAA